MQATISNGYEFAAYYKTIIITNMLEIAQFLKQPNLSLQLVIASIAIMAFFATQPFINRVDKSRNDTAYIPFLKTLDVLILIFCAIAIITISIGVDTLKPIYRLQLTLASTFVAVLMSFLVSVNTRKRFGEQREVDGKTIFTESYGSRLIDILLAVFIALLTIYAVIKIWNFDSLLETTGLFGIVIGFAALTSSVWLPDLMSGLIILNAKILKDGDLVVIDGYSSEYLISKVSFIYTILYDVRNNHRTLIRNNRFIQSKVDNLSRIASTDGIRQTLSYKIGYPKFPGQTGQQRLEQLAVFEEKIDRMFTKVYDLSVENDAIKINQTKSFDWVLAKTDDYSLEYRLFVYLERLPNTKITSLARKHLMGTLYKINTLVYRQSIAEGIDLQTPALLELTRSALQDLPTQEGGIAP